MTTLREHVIDRHAQARPLISPRQRGGLGEVRALRASVPITPGGGVLGARVCDDPIWHKVVALYRRLGLLADDATDHPRVVAGRLGRDCECASCRPVQSSA